MKTQLKRRLTQAGLVAGVVTMMIGSAGFVSAADSKEQEKPATIAVTMAPAGGIYLQGGLLQQPTFQRNYLKLLVNTYAPEMAKEWQQALDDRKQAESEMPSPSTASATISTTAAQTITLSKSDAGTKTLTTQAAQAIPVEEKATSGIIKSVASEIKPVVSEAFERQQKLAAAVESDDAATIRSLLPALLKDYRAETEQLHKLAQDLKTNPALQAQPTQPSTK